MEPRNRVRGIDSDSLCSLASRYDKKSCRTGPPFWKSIPGLLKRSTNTGSVSIGQDCDMEWGKTRGRGRGERRSDDIKPGGGGSSFSYIKQLNE